VAGPEATKTAQAGKTVSLVAVKCEAYGLSTLLAERFVDEALIALKSAIHAKRFDPGMLEALARTDGLQCAEKHEGKFDGRNPIRDPCASLAIEEAGNAVRGWQGSNGKSADSGLEQGVGQPFLA
jgi:hypothetical protein